MLQCIIKSHQVTPEIQFKYSHLVTKVSSFFLWESTFSLNRRNKINAITESKLVHNVDDAVVILIMSRRHDLVISSVKRLSERDVFTEVSATASAFDVGGIWRTEAFKLKPQKPRL
jgi:hypothetical protein